MRILSMLAGAAVLLLSGCGYGEPSGNGYVYTPPPSYSPPPSWTLMPSQRTSCGRNFC